MPHKHTRKGVDKSTTTDLPPSILARPLSTSKSAASNGIFTTEINAPKRTNKKRKRRDDTDDTPKAFARLMAFKEGRKLPKGLDDGVRVSKKAKKAANKKIQAEDEDEERGDLGKRVTGPEVPTIRVGERMSEFSARVDAALPVGGLINKSAKGGKDPLGLKVGRTKTEKRMHRMYDEWRAEEARIQEKRSEALELAEEEGMDSDGQVKWKSDMESKPSSKKKGKKGKKKKVLGEVDDGDDDPWEKLKRERGGKVGINDVVLAPPTFKKVPSEKFKVRGARVEVGDVPKASGSLRRREELGEVRRSVVEGYRTMMKKGKENIRL